MSVKQCISTSISQNRDAKAERRNKYLTIVGCSLVLCNNGLIWYWGNMSVYCMSYFVSVLNVTSGVQSPWVFSSFMIAWTLGVLASGSISVRIGKPSTIMLGAVIFNAGVFCSYFAVQNSLPALTVSIGVAPGLGTGLMDGSGLQLGLEWAGERIGLVTCILQGAFSLGALLINQIITMYTNPNNLTPDFYISPTEYFTQKDVLDRVPSMFLVIGCYTSCFHVIGCLMLREKAASNEIHIVNGKTSENKTLSRVELQNYNTTENSVVLQRKEKVNGGVGNITMNSSSETPLTTHVDKLSGSTIGEDKVYTFREVLKTKSFYSCWMCFFSTAMANMLAGSYYKAFGQIWIKDDHFITNIATLMSLGSSVVSAIMGVAIDYLGAKKCCMFAIGSMALLLFWYYFTPMLNRWLYLATVLVFASLVGSLFSAYTAVTALLYGKEHFSTNYGLLMSANLTFNLISPYFVGYLLTHVGWFAMYTFTGSLLVLSLIPMALFVPNV